MNRLYLFPLFLFFTCCHWDNNNTLIQPVPLSPPLTIVSDIAPPPGYKRIILSNNSFGQWLRNVPLKKNNHVYLYDGSLKPNQSVQFAVMDMPIGTKDLQQCADAIYRLRTEYFFKTNQLNQIAFKATDGTLLSFSDWRKGTRYKLSGKNLSSYQISAVQTDIRKDLELFLEIVFLWCGTYSLQNKTLPVSINAILPGDVLVKGGSPGHAMIVMDVAINDKGNKLFMLAQSYMPAQDIHIVKNSTNASLSPWYEATVKRDIITHQWQFSVDQLRRW